MRPSKKNASRLLNQEKLCRGLILCVLVLAALVFIIPLLITVFAAFKTPMQLGAESPLTPPRQLYLENFKTAFVDGQILLGFKNSLLLVIFSVVINVVLGTMAAYAIGRFKFRFKKLIMGMFMLGLILPSNLTEIPRFITLTKLGVYNSLAAPIIIYAATDMIQLSMYLQFINGIPKALDESARIDGCTYFGVFTRIILPLMKPAIATMAIIKVVWVVNDMYVPYLYMPSSKLRTLTTTLMNFSSTRQGTWNNLSAAIILVALPTLLLYIFFQKYIFSGIVAGAVKE